MSTKDEKSKNNQYIFRHKSGALGNIITYKKNLVDAIQKDVEAIDTEALKAMQNFRFKNMTDARFEEFIENAKKAGYEIYKVMEL